MPVAPPIAVVGMAGVFPGALSLEVFWQNIVQKKSAVADIPADRWIVAADEVLAGGYATDKTCSRRAGLIRNFDFDAGGFELDAELLNQLDPMVQIVLTAGRAALAEYPQLSIDRKRTGVVLASIALPTDASSFLAREVNGRAFTDRVRSSLPETWRGSIASRPFAPLTRAECLSARVTGLSGAILARALGLGGGSYTLDAACASSLYAVKLACDELQAGRTDLMLAGGVSRPDSLYTQIGFTQLQALSPTGRCAPFDVAADGLVVGEGAGLLVLKRLEDALRDDNPIHAVIRGAGLSNDIGGNLLAPNSEGQLRAMQAAYRESGWSPADVDLIECHGAGTPVGDAIELTSLRRLWGEDGWTPAQCAIGSIKSMIGHLLTAAGAAGMIKTVLALANRVLPPSINFDRPREDSPLIGSPFRVQTAPREWAPRSAGTPRRAAVSAFGFGGINAHLLLEEWPRESAGSGVATAAPPTERALVARSDEERPAAAEPPPIAIIGMDAAFGGVDTLRDLQEVIFNGRSLVGRRPSRRWCGADAWAEKQMGAGVDFGAFMENLSVFVGEFHIPPNEIPDILPQHLLMLKTAAGAMADAGLPHRDDRPRMGATIGLEYDHGANDFHLRWNVGNEARRWRLPGMLAPDAHREWLRSLRNAASPPLTSARTIGALGAIVASRIAKEFRLGGPSFIVSCDAASGLKALEIGVRSLQRHETDLFLVGAVDLAGDVRNLVAAHGIKPFANTPTPLAFDDRAVGPVPGEGAAAVVLKRLDRALADGDRIYAVVKGVGGASRGGIDPPAVSTEAYLLSLERCFKDAKVSPSAVSFVEAHGSGHADEDRLEIDALGTFFSLPGHRPGGPEHPRPIGIGAIKPTIGHAGAAAGLASIVKTGLCLYHEIMPPLSGFASSAMAPDLSAGFHFPAFSHYWTRNRSDGPRRALVGCMTTDGNCSHILMEGVDDVSGYRAPETMARVERERRRPAGLRSAGLFLVTGSEPDSLIQGLNALQQFIRRAGEEPVEATARRWQTDNRSRTAGRLAVALIADDLFRLGKWITEAQKAVRNGVSSVISGSDGFKYTPAPIGPDGEVAFVFPGSGNHYIGMGRDIGTVWPGILRRMDAETDRLRDQMRPEAFVPFRASWQPGWEKEAEAAIARDPHTSIFGQVMHGGTMANLIQFFEVRPNAVIGYSLGESAGLFAMGAWPDRDEMLQRMERSPLFQTELAGPCNAARKVWRVPPDEDVDWRVAAVNRPAEAVKKVLRKFPAANLLIVNTPAECVIGGRGRQVAAAIARLGCDAFYLHGVVTVHCEAAVPVKEAYRQIHLFPAVQPSGIRFYSCTFEKAYTVTSEKAATSILNQALFGFDFPATVRQAHRDGVRVFVEVGPNGSCTRMINAILADERHLAVSACTKGEDSFLTVLKCLGTLAAERVPVNLDRLYGEDAYPTAERVIEDHTRGREIRVAIGGRPPSPPPFPVETPLAAAPSSAPPVAAVAAMSASPSEVLGSLPDHPFTAFFKPVAETIAATAETHDRFLAFSAQMQAAFAETIDYQQRLLERLVSPGAPRPAGWSPPPPVSVTVGAPDPVPAAEDAFPPSRAESRPPSTDNAPSREVPAYDRDKCMAFAVGSAAAVLGPEFAALDTYKVRVRLPDEPLMLVDRILSVEGEKGSLGAGRVVTEHDVHKGAWYLDGGRAPSCISIEAGQADLFLCSYLGIDRVVKGERAYRLLDAVATFHTGLPVPGDTLRYDIKIKKFIRSGQTYMFFFEFDGYRNDAHMISMRDGCAGFFTPEEVAHSGGIILTEDERKPIPGKLPDDWQVPVPMATESYSSDQIDALRSGDAQSCFGPRFAGVRLAESIRLPDGRMKLIHRVPHLDPEGGRYGLGTITAEADIHPDDWFLTCHFVDDKVMPGTLMYECCVHTLRVFLLRMGWVTDKEGVCYEPVPGIGATLKCRGPVTTDTRTVSYQVDLKEIGYNPEPYVIADALMYADGDRIVMFRNMCLKMSGLTRDEVEAYWTARRTGETPPGDPTEKPTRFSREQILTFAEGNPSDAFGDRYKPFDRDRFMARLPRPPYLCMDRVTRIDPEQWVLKAGGWVEAEYRIPEDVWYVRANRVPAVPFCFLLEIALQPCGWTAAYCGSALRSDTDLKFRNLGGRAVLHRELRPDDGLLTMRASMTKVSEAGGMIIEEFVMEVLAGREMIYSGSTYFGFFSRQALDNQAGIPNAAKIAFQPAPADLDTDAARASAYRFPNDAPLTPDDTATTPAPTAALPARSLRMIDEIAVYLPDGGPAGLGFVRGLKTVVADEWFFHAHFYQDPVCPGSLGIESFLQLMKYAALQKWPDLADTHTFQQVAGEEHHWTYRGQVVQSNKLVEVDAWITRIDTAPHPTLFADGYLKVDGLYIYEMKNFGIRLVPAT